MNLGMLPIAGITLPLISYGGSSLITWMIGLGFLSLMI
jgi:cell division protein FtsW (lipid II flippase)